MNQPQRSPFFTQPLCVMNTLASWQNKKSENKTKTKQTGVSEQKVQLQAQNSLPLLNERIDEKRIAPKDKTHTRCNQINQENLTQKKKKRKEKLGMLLWRARKLVSTPATTLRNSPLCARTALIGPVSRLLCGQ